jgi:3-methyladenine DNA glycosylase AlkD
MENTAANPPSPSTRLTDDVRSALRSAGNPEKAKLLMRFFKTGKGEYGEGDRFLGVTVPAQRIIARAFADLPLRVVLKLLRSGFHEERLTALLVLVRRFEKGRDEERERIYRAYLENTKWINNWDLVDLSAPRIVGARLVGRDRRILYGLVRSKNLWERRIAVLATFAFIDRGDFKDALAIADLLLEDSNDLIHKAVGWLLREIGKKDRCLLDDFLKTHASRMPRTMLRYAIERHPERIRRRWLAIPREGRESA